ncbi:hypothetical protein, partial [Bradyrhizobium japonicum]|uniref:hypothetical protein n=1 Tax=Bradyrhizobium japonicum TaxID=375 RepID=UPI00190F8063
DISDRGELVGFSLGEGADFQIDIHAGNGQVTQFWSIREDREIDSLPEITKTITAEEAKNVEIKQKKPVLTYFLPGVDWRYGELVEKSQPMLVYR